MAVKRRVIWMTDGDWETITRQAGDESKSVSRFIRDRMHSPIGRIAAVTQDRDGVTIEVERQAGTFSSRPFRPVPKSGR